MTKEILEGVLNEISEIYKINIFSEYKFSNTRKFRLDYFIDIDSTRNSKSNNLDNIKGVGIELDGGVWVQGRHIRPLGYIRDCEKCNLALSLGVPVLRYTYEHLKDIEKVKEEIEQVINQLLKIAS